MTNEAATLVESQLAWSGTTAPHVEASQFDLQLARRIACGEMQAFEEFYRRYHRRVYTLCLRMTHNIAEAEDLTQEVFIHIYRKIGSFRGESAMMTWVHRVTVNQVLMHFRKGVVRRERVTDDGETPELAVDDAATPAQMFSLDRLALERAIAALPPGYRATFILHDIEGYEHAEIARMRGSSVGTSKSQLHKARLKLRELLKQEREPQAPKLIGA